MKRFNHPKKGSQGFTLIELSIVLVIIGLIVGGVLVGQDLIKAAELRATIGQLEKYNAAVNTFRGKFGGIPGDLQATEASSFGLFSLTVDPAIGLADGNGLIQDTAGGTGPNGEPLIFWRHMSDASLIDGAFGSTGANAINPANGQTTGTVADVSQSLPSAKMGRGNYFAVYSNSGTNFYEMNSVYSVAAAGYLTQTTSQMSPREAYSMDSKIDDGQPNTGNVRAKGPVSVAGGLNQDPVWHAAGQTGDCIQGGAAVTDATNTYWLVSEVPTCAIRARFN